MEQEVIKTGWLQKRMQELAPFPKGYGVAWYVLKKDEFGNLNYPVVLYPMPLNILFYFWKYRKILWTSRSRFYPWFKSLIKKFPSHHRGEKPWSIERHNLNYFLQTPTFGGFEDFTDFYGSSRDRR